MALLAVLREGLETAVILLAPSRRVRTPSSPAWGDPRRLVGSVQAGHYQPGGDQQPLLNLTWLVRPGSVQAAVLTGMLGLQPRPTQIEVGGWVIYVALAT